MPNNQSTNGARKLAVVPGAASGIGYYLADECASHGYDLVVAADEKRIMNAAEGVRITGSIAGFAPGAYHAVYNGTKAFINSFSFALRAELEDSGVSVTCLMPGATETEFFAAAGMLDTKLGADKKDSAEKVARDGFKAMLRGDGDIVSGWHNKLQTLIANVTPAGLVAEEHKKKAAPGSARQ
jgi:short-subunit dehydrogenase